MDLPHGIFSSTGANHGVCTGADYVRSRGRAVGGLHRTGTANTLCQLFGQIYALAGIDGASSHSGRRWFITQLAHSGVSAKVIMTLAGHRHLSTTQRYIEVNDQMMKAAVEVL
jgi:integrase